MLIGNGAWAVGWIGCSIVLAVVASLVGPRSLERTIDPVVMVRIAPGPFLMGSEVDSGAELLRSTYRNAIPPARPAAASGPVTFRYARGAE